MVFPGEEEVMHKHDEYVKIDRLITASKIYVAAIVALATNEDSMKNVNVAKLYRDQEQYADSND